MKRVATMASMVVCMALAAVRGQEELPEATAVPGANGVHGTEVSVFSVPSPSHPSPGVRGVLVRVGPVPAGTTVTLPTSAHLELWHAGACVAALKLGPADRSGIPDSLLRQAVPGAALFYFNLDLAYADGSWVAVRLGETVVTIPLAKWVEARKGPGKKGDR